MTRPLSAAEQDQQDAMTALRQPAKPQTANPWGKVIYENEAKISRQRTEIKRLVDCNRALRAEIDRLRAAEAQA